jgi:hypothetical protein
VQQLLILSECNRHLGIDICARHFGGDVQGKICPLVELAAGAMPACAAMLTGFTRL